MVIICYLGFHKIYNWYRYNMKLWYISWFLHGFYLMIRKLWPTFKWFIKQLFWWLRSHVLSACWLSQTTQRYAIRNVIPFLDLFGRWTWKASRILGGLHRYPHQSLDTCPFMCVISPRLVHLVPNLHSTPLPNKKKRTSVSHDFAHSNLPCFHGGFLKWGIPKTIGFNTTMV